MQGESTHAEQQQRASLTHDHTRLASPPHFFSYASNYAPGSHPRPVCLLVHACGGPRPSAGGAPGRGFPRAPAWWSHFCRHRRVRLVPVPPPRRRGARHRHVCFVCHNPQGWDGMLLSSGWCISRRTGGAVRCGAPNLVVGHKILSLQSNARQATRDATVPRAYEPADHPLSLSLCVRRVATNHVAPVHYRSSQTNKGVAVPQTIHEVLQIHGFPPSSRHFLCSVYSRVLLAILSLIKL